MAQTTPSPRVKVPRSSITITMAPSQGRTRLFEVSPEISAGATA